MKGLETASRFFCSELSRRAGESPAGTASTGANWFLLEYPHGWGRHALEDSALSGDVKRFFDEATKRVPRSRVLFIKTDRGRRDACMNLFVVRCRERAPSVVRLRLEKYDDLLAVDLDAIVAGANLQGGEVMRGPLFLVCTHGKRDKCCAKFGLALYNSLRETEGEAVWQSSHVGGDRFAANLVCFPHGLFYAHMFDTEGKRVASEYRAGRIHLEKFRGRACYAHHVQAAEVFARAESGIDGLDRLRFHSSERAGEKVWRVRFFEPGASRVHEARVSCRMSGFKNFITCHSEEERPVPQFTLDAYNIKPAP